MERGTRIYVAGGDTLAGAAILEELVRRGYTRILNIGGEEPDLTDPRSVDEFFSRETPDCVFVSAGKSGGIHANQQFPADLMRNNLQVGCHVIDSAWRHKTGKLLYLGSSCVYPRECPQPMREDSLMTGPLEPTNEAYAMAKLAGMVLCRAYRQQFGACFIAAIPANIFGPGDHFGEEDSHVIPALIGKMHHAKTHGLPFVDLWGTGAPRREFLFADDLADACIFLMNVYDRPDPINIGGGTDLTIRELAAMVKESVGYAGAIRFDASKPDGMPRKSLDATEILSLGWRPKTPFRDALKSTYKGFLSVEGNRGND